MIQELGDDCGGKQKRQWQKGKTRENLGHGRQKRCDNLVVREREISEWWQSERRSEKATQDHDLGCQGRSGTSSGLPP